MSDRELDIVLFGATGFTGRLVGEYLARAPGRPRWAIAGRNRAKLEALGLGVPVVVADAADGVALAALARRTKVVCTTAGPYARIGSELVAACAEHGTHYCDLTGEVAWMRRMIDAHHQRAQASGARIVHTCGFDSIPSDLGVWALQQEMLKAFGMPATSVTALFGPLRGRASGGTIASAVGIANEASADRGVRRLLANPHALDPDPAGWHPPDRDGHAIGWDGRLRVFTAPFVMASVNTRVVRRSHALAGAPWGEDFVYREVMSTGGAVGGLVRATAVTGGMAALALALSRPRLRALIARRAPQPGEGPSEPARARGHWRVRLVGEIGEHRLVYLAEDRHGDPGYASTAKMLGESALCLALDPLTSAGGVITPSVAMGGRLVERLRKAGLTWEVVPRL
jgi:short subunit dehydrogenase-like uncharacterized protein